MALKAATSNPSNPTGKSKGSRDLPPEVPRDQWDRPRIVPPGHDPHEEPPRDGYTRASTLGGVLEDQFGLNEWKSRLVGRGVALRPDLVVAFKSLRSMDRSEDKKAATSLVKKALEVAEADAKATVGTAIHGLTDRYDSGEEVPHADDYEPTMVAYRAAIEDFIVHGIEVFVVADAITTAGTFDRLVSPRGLMVAPDGTRYGPNDRLIWDLKTSQTADYFGLKFCVQLTVYAHGDVYVPGEGRLPWPDGIAPDRRWGLILHAPSGGDIAQLYWVNLTLGVKLIELALEVKKWRSFKDLIFKADPPIQLSLEELISASKDGDDLTALYASYKPLWTPLHSSLASKRMQELATLAIEQ